MSLHCAVARKELAKIRTDLKALQLLNTFGKAELAVDTMQRIEALVLELKHGFFAVTMRTIAHDWTNVVYDIHGNVAKAIERYTGQKTSGSASILRRPDGMPAGRIDLDGKPLLFNGTQILRTIDGYGYRGVRSLTMMSDGRLAGAAVILGGWLPFVGNTLLYSVNGTVVVDCDLFEEKNDGLSCRVQLAGSTSRHRISWDGMHDATIIS